MIPPSPLCKELLGEGVESPVSWRIWSGVKSCRAVGDVDAERGWELLKVEEDGKDGIVREDGEESWIESRDVLIASRGRRLVSMPVAEVGAESC